MLRESCKVIIQDDIYTTSNDGDKIVILNYNSGKYYGLDQMGAYYWSLIESCSTLVEIIETTLKNFKATEEQVKKDLVDLIQQLQYSGLVIIK